MAHHNRHHQSNRPAPQERVPPQGWLWTRLKTGEKVATVIGILTIVVAIFTIPGVLDVFHKKKPTTAETPRTFPPQSLTVRVRPDSDLALLPDGSVRIQTNEAEKLVLYRVKPVWPKGMEHKVFSVQVFVGPDGNVIGLSPNTSDQPLIDIITDAIGQWKFKPFLRYGKPQKFQAVLYLHS